MKIDLNKRLLGRLLGFYHVRQHFAADAHYPLTVPVQQLSECLFMASDRLSHKAGKIIAGRFPGVTFGQLYTL
jgi:hypothetical protein